MAIKLLLDWKKYIITLNQTLYVACKIASSESEKSNLGQRYDNDNDVIHVSSRRLCPHTLHWVAFEKNGVDTETVPPFSFWRHVGIEIEILGKCARSALKQLLIKPFLTELACLVNCKKVHSVG